MFCQKHLGLITSVTAKMHGLPVSRDHYNSQSAQDDTSFTSWPRHCHVISKCSPATLSQGCQERL